MEFFLIYIWVVYAICHDNECVYLFDPKNLAGKNKAGSKSNKKKSVPDLWSIQAFYISYMYKANMNKVSASNNYVNCHLSHNKMGKICRSNDPCDMTKKVLVKHQSILLIGLNHKSKRLTVLGVNPSATNNNYNKHILEFYNVLNW